jgi:hypothetical protein
MRKLFLILAVTVVVGLLTIGATTSYSIPSPNQIYGGMYETAGGTAITLTTAGTYYQWVNTTVGASNGMTVSATSDDITVLTAGTYHVTGTCSFTATANAIITMRVYEEGVGQTNCTGQRKISAGGDVGNMGLNCFIASVVNDSYDLRFTADADTKSVVPTECNLTAVRVGS